MEAFVFANVMLYRPVAQVVYKPLHSIIDANLEWFIIISTNLEEIINTETAVRVSGCVKNKHKSL